jgi:hypothetical protein
MRASTKLLALVLIFGAMLGLGEAARADILILKDGQAISGKFQGGDPGGISFLVDGQYRRYALSDIYSITIMPVSTTSTSSNPGSTSSGSSAPSYSTGRINPPTPSSQSSTYPPPAPYPPTNSGSSGSGGWSTRPSASGSSSSMGLTIPSGTTITVRMIDPVDSSVNQTGETFRASLDEPIVVNGQTIASRGANVTTKLVDVQEAGRVTGRSELALVLYDVTINGRKYEVTTEEVSQQGSSRGTQSAQRIGGLAVLGAVIGAVAGGGKGAAQGAVAGAGAGTAIQVLTHGDKVQIPAESRLEFTLSNPLNL